MWGWILPSGPQYHTHTIISHCMLGARPLNCSDCLFLTTPKWTQGSEAQAGFFGGGEESSLTFPLSGPSRQSQRRVVVAPALWKAQTRFGGSAWQTADAGVGHEGGGEPVGRMPASQGVQRHLPPQELLASIAEFTTVPVSKAPCGISQAWPKKSSRLARTRHLWTSGEGFAGSEGR